MASKRRELRDYELAKYYKAGNKCFEDGRFDTAISNYTQVIKRAPGYKSAYYNRGLAHACKEDYDKAISDLTRMVKIKPNHALAYYCRGLAYEYKLKYVTAKKDYRKALRLSPGDKDALRRYNLCAQKSHTAVWPKRKKRG